MFSKEAKKSKKNIMVSADPVGTRRSSRILDRSKREVNSADDDEGDENSAPNTSHGVKSEMPFNERKMPLEECHRKMVTTTLEGNLMSLGVVSSVSRAASPIILPRPVTVIQNNNECDSSLDSSRSAVSTKNGAIATSSRTRTTTTSRRGGRTARSRSPASTYRSRLERRDSSIALPSTTACVIAIETVQDNIHEINETEIGNPSSSFPRPPNPSSAAAAAAAAAKRLCDTPNHHWYNEQAPEDIESAAACERPSKSHWHSQSRGVGFAGNTNPTNPIIIQRRSNFRTDDEGDSAYEEDSGGHGYSHSREMSDNFRRHRLHRDDEEGNAQMGSFNVELCNSSQVINRITKSNDEFKKHTIGRGGTSQIMGSAAPIHMPRREMNDEKSRHDEDDERIGEEGNPPSSVFRERSHHTDKKEAKDNSPQRILMSLRSDTRSFDLKSPVAKPKLSVHTKKSGEAHFPFAPLSPEAPPQIQYSRRAFISNFEPQKTPRTPLGIKSPGQSFKSPTFNLFGRSFDSLSDQLLPANSSLLPLMPSVDENSPKKLHFSSSIDFASVPFSPHLRSKTKLGASSDFLNSPGGISLGNAFDVPLTPHTPRVKEVLLSKRNSTGIVFRQKDRITDSEVQGLLEKSSESTDKGGGGRQADRGNQQGSRSRQPPYMPKESQMISTDTEKSHRIYLPRNNGKIVSIHPNNQPERSNQEVFRKKPSSATPVTFHRDVKEKEYSSTSRIERRAMTEVRRSEPSTRNRIPEGPHRSSGFPLPCEYGRKERPRNSMSSKQTRKTDIFSERSRPSLSGMDATVFYQRLLGHKQAFKNYTFLLPSLQNALIPEKNIKVETTSTMELKEASTPKRATEACMNSNGCTPEHPPVSMATVSYSPETPHSEVGHENISSLHAVAQRRVTSAICAFGGRSSQKKSNQTQEIFREKKDSEPTVEEEKSKYQQLLSNRYYENEDRISWEIEENPPVELSSNVCTNSESLRKNGAVSPGIKRRSPSPSEKQISKRSKTMMEGRDPNSIKNQTNGNNQSNNDQPKMRYRCKLCGQPKQNHTCPYQQSLQRSIGVMVHTAVNAFTSCEPGLLAPALSEMNNFVNGQDNYVMENTPGRPGMTTFRPPAMMTRHVTPEIMRAPLHHNLRKRGNSPSSMSDQSFTPRRPPYRVNPYSQIPVGSLMVSQPTPGSLRRKRVLSPGTATSSTQPSGSSSDLLFVDATDLRPEQFRIISTQPSGSYKYPPLPLPYGQRKNLSDNLFALSKEISQLTDECAIVLREAREKDMWDSAVAELLTQVVVVIHCPEDDKNLDGLSLYLLSLGFAC